jgi:hypothetical protein
LLLPALAKAKERARRANCVSNLKQVSLGFKTYALDNDSGKFPWRVDWPSEYGIPNAMKKNTWMEYNFAGAQIENPKILVCPSDKATTRIASHFTSPTDPVTQDSFAHATMQANALSYWVGSDALSDSERVMCLLAGDRNIGVGLAPLSTETCDPNNVNVPANVLRRGDVNIGWTNAIHGNIGNVVLVEGSVQSVSSSGLRELLDDPAFADANGNNHILMPK